MKTQPVFTFENAKTSKGEPLGYLTAIRYLAPADESGYNVCANAGACKAVCLYTAGRGAFAKVKAARVAKTLRRRADVGAHLEQASQEIDKAQRKAARMGVTLAVRVNGTSDLLGDALSLARRHPGVQFYDYTKLLGSVRRYVAGEYPPNYHLTLSYDVLTVPWEACSDALAAGMGVAVVFNTKALPSYYRGVPVIDGDAHDLRFLDHPPPGHVGSGFVVGLSAKGLAKKADPDGFVVDVKGGQCS